MGGLGSTRAADRGTTRECDDPTIRTRDEPLLVLVVAYFLVRRFFGANATVTRREYPPAGPGWHATVAHACTDLVVESLHRDAHHQGRPRSMNVALTAT